MAFHAFHEYRGFNTTSIIPYEAPETKGAIFIRLLDLFSLYKSARIAIARKTHFHVGVGYFDDEHSAFCVRRSEGGNYCRWNAIIIFRRSKVSKVSKVSYYTNKIVYLLFDSRKYVSFFLLLTCYSLSNEL